MKYGYLTKRSNTWYKKWTEKFFVLCDLGLIYMEKPNDEEIKLYPFTDFVIVPISYGTYLRPQVFQLQTPQNKYNMTIQANSEKDYNEWVIAIRDFQKKIESVKAKQIGGEITSNKKEN